jgi:uncharacterized RDD family membrane protein YckC
MYCPSCGAEYRPGFAECPDCHVALVKEQPPPPRRRVHDDKLDHETVAYDVSDWEPVQFRALDMMLASAHVAHGLEDGMLVVPRVHQYDVDEIVDTIDAGDFVEEPVPERTAAPARQRPRGLPLASPWSRVIAFIIDGVVVQIAWLPFAGIRHTHRLVASIGGLALSGAYLVTAIAVWGCTIGTRVWKLRVVTTTGQVPGWRRAAVRWAIPSVFAVLTVIVRGEFDASSKWRGALTALGALWFLVVYLGVFRDKQRQGLHDKAAGTIVVDNAYRP